MGLKSLLSFLWQDGKDNANKADSVESALRVVYRAGLEAIGELVEPEAQNASTCDTCDHYMTAEDTYRCYCIVRNELKEQQRKAWKEICGIENKQTKGEQ